jgi:hypothetical protein
MALMWRSIVHFVTRIDDRWYVSVPGWGLQALVGLKIDEIPEFILGKVEDGFRCFAKVNLGEEDPLNLRFEDWETPILCEMCKRGVFTGAGFDLLTLKCCKCGCLVKN